MVLDCPRCCVDLGVRPPGLGPGQPLSSPSSDGRWAPSSVPASVCRAWLAGPLWRRSVRPHRFLVLASAKEGEKSSECHVFANLVFISIRFGLEGRVSKTGPRTPLPEAPLWTLAGIRVLGPNRIPDTWSFPSPDPPLPPPGQTPFPLCSAQHCAPRSSAPTRPHTAALSLVPSPTGCLRVRLDTRVPGRIGG